MTWWNEDYRRRQIVAINAFGGTGTTATIDVEIQIPSDWDGFWDNIRSDFKDVVLTNNLGEQVTFQRSTADYANRNLVLQIDNLSINNDDAMNSCFLYFSYPDEATDHSSSFTATSPKAGKVLLSAPHSRVVSAKSSSNVTQQPLQTFSKSSSEELHVFFRFSSELANRIESYNNRTDEEAIDFLIVESLNSAGVNDTGRYDQDETYFGNGFVRATYKGGSDGTTYAILIRYQTTLKQVIESRAFLFVKDQLPD